MALCITVIVIQKNQLSSIALGDIITRLASAVKMAARDSASFVSHEKESGNRDPICAALLHMGDRHRPADQPSDR